MSHYIATCVGDVLALGEWYLWPLSSLNHWLGQKFPKSWRKIYATPRAKTITAFSSSKQVMESLHGPNTMKQSRSIAL